ncbi:AAA family ATPase [Paraglaciecola sp.]|uniref:AAA family ATPase n=1 Tax=Paraglaciecola sp. TaxID=1920173 RepID=UPI003263E473
MAENFRSIGSTIELNLKAAPRMRRKKSHVRTPTKIKDLKVLKTGVIYGPNASGKSNILKALEFFKELIVDYRKPNTFIEFDQFKMDEKPNKNTKFYIEFVCAEVLFGFGVELNNERIVEESLIAITKNEEHNIYNRKFENGKYIFDLNTDVIDKNLTKEQSKEQFDALKYIGAYTAKNKLFISECNERNISEQHSDFIGNIVNIFFRYHLVLIFPETKYAGLVTDIKNRAKGECEYIDLLSDLDTGLDDIALTEVQESAIDKELLDKIKEDLSQSNNDISFEFAKNQYQIEYTKEGEFKVYKLEAVHKLANNKQVKFSLYDESDGTKRLLDLMPAICRKRSQEHDVTYVIDEFDRSLHPNLAKLFLEMFLDSEDDVNSDQLIVTTHEAELLDKDLLRRDEIWFVQKERNKSTSLYSLNDYSTRFDKDIHKAYLEGKFGAIPNIVKKFKRI